LSSILSQEDTSARSIVEAAAEKPTVLQGKGKYRSNLNSARMASNAFSNKATNTGYANAPTYNFAADVSRSFRNNVAFQANTPQSFGISNLGTRGTLDTFGTPFVDTSFAGTNQRAFGTPAPRQQAIVRQRFRKNSFSNNGF
jgi:hypothetical protein